MTTTSATAAALAVAVLPIRAETFQKVQTEVRDRSGADIRWEKQMAAREETAAVVAKLLRQPLTVASAVQIALISNRGLQATFGEIGIAQSDVIEAVTVPNPSVDFDVQFPVVAAQMNRYGWLVAQEFVQILMIPLKKKIAGERLEAAELRVAAETLRLVAEVKAAYFTYQGDQQLLARLKIIQETNAAALDLAQKQFEAGNITDFALLQSQSSYSQGRLDLVKAETDLRSQREKLNRLLGLWGEDTDWEIKGDIMPVPDSGFTTKRLESLAVAQRLDLRAAHRDLTGVIFALGLSKTYRWVPVLNMGFTGERDTDGALNMGPSLSIELPIFNQGQSRIARGEAQLRMAESKLEALAVDIRSEVRELRDRLLSLADMAKYYHDDLLPTRIRMVNNAILEYNAMQVSPYELFLVKSQEVDAERGYIDTLRDYWITRAELERAVGGTLTPRKQAPSLSQDKTVVKSTQKEKKR
jgi:outer membrane protein, heavy metal efflux system